MASLPPIQPGHPADTGVDATCMPRERASAIVAIVIAFLVAVFVFMAAFLAHRGGGGGDGGMGGAGALAGGGAGIGDGTGVGPGSGTGASDSGNGPGAGDEGAGRGAIGPDEAIPPAGSASDVVAARKPEPAPAPDPGPEVAPPEFGFTAPDPPKPTPRPKPPAVVTGSPTGGPSKGASGASGGGGSEFMGIRSVGEHVVYVIDRSGSMGADARFTHACLELKRSIERLPTSGSFSVIFFSFGPLAMPPGTLVKATKRSKEEAATWIGTVTPLGNTDPILALRQALAMRPQAIYLMTDGAFDDPEGVLRVIDQSNADRAVSINTIAFYDRSSEFILQKIARENKGDYRFVGPAGVGP